jgi:sulfur-carrier protein
VATGTIRYWAAARAAAGVPEDRYDGETLADALRQARALRGETLASVLDRCSFVVDAAPVGGRAHDAVRLTEGGTVEVLPPFAGGAAAGEPAPDTIVGVPTEPTPGSPAAVPASPAVPTARTAAAVARSGRDRRASQQPTQLPATTPGLLAGVVAAALAGLALLGTAPLGVGVFAVQVVVGLAWLATLDARGSTGAFVIGVAASIGCDIVVGVSDGPDVGRAALVVALAVLASLVHQLLRRPRRGVTLSIAATLSMAVFACCAASYVALRVEGGGGIADAAALFGAGVALAVARLVDVVLPRPAVVPESRRGVVGLLVGLAAAAATGWIYGHVHAGVLGSDHGVRMAIVTALIALLADLAVDAVLSTAPPDEERSVAALTPLGMLLPVVLSGPAAYVAGRILLG